MTDNSVLVPNELKRIVFYYFLENSNITPDNYMNQIINEIANRSPLKEEIYNANNYYKWLKKYHLLLENYMIELIYNLKYIPNEEYIFQTFQQKYNVILSPEEIWKQIIYNFLNELKSSDIY
jgi:hypothetical protein